jgi:O-antigen ligase
MAGQATITKLDAAPGKKNRLGIIACFLALLGFGVVVTLYSFYAFAFLGAVIAFGVLLLATRYLRRSGLETWQIVLLSALSGYLLLNYGFENVAFHLGGLPIILSYLLMFTALGLAALAHPDLLRVARQEPAIYFLIALFILACFHLIVNIPAYGIWAIRDASMCFDCMFIVLGLLWARRKENLMPLMKWLMVIFLLNALYSLTFPWQESISAASPTSGVFLPIPLFGNYRGNFLYLGLGALFYLFLSRNVVKWPRSLVVLCAMVQLFGLAILQARQMYVALALILVLLVVVGEAKKSGKLLLILGAPIAAILILTATGIEIPGRIGPVRADFFLQHFRSISGAEDTPGASVQGRMDWYNEVFSRIRKNPWLGEGFGQPLITFENELTGGVVRQPHNSTVTILARLGVIGLIPWLGLHIYIIKRFICAYRVRARLDALFRDFLLWLFMLYLVFMISALVEPSFEFPSGAIPFYFFLGLALGLIRWQVPTASEQETSHTAVPDFAPSLFSSEQLT